MTSFSELLNKKIKEIDWDADGIHFTTFDGETFKYVPMGDCCAHAYIESFDNVDWLIGEEIISGDHLTFNSEDTEYGVIDYHRYSISSKKGTASIELRVSHNGYYGGWLEFVK